jgi:CO dehydrogenase/acetyl-CoA synthase delta subunit
MHERKIKQCLEEFLKDKHAVLHFTFVNVVCTFAVRRRALHTQWQQQTRNQMIPTTECYGYGVSTV